LDAAGADVFGLSTQSTAEQAEAAQRLHLPFPLLADEHVVLAKPPLRLPTFKAGDAVRYRRLTMVISGGRIEHVFYPVFPPDGHAGQVLAWLRVHASDRSS
jgi:peroxiredoxin